MRVISKGLALAVLFVSFAYGVSDGTISGVVKDPDGAPFRGAFVRARNQTTKITTSVLSDKQGRYSVTSLPPGTYDFRATAIGFGDDQRSGVKVVAGESPSMDFGLKKGMVRWSDLTSYQGMKLLPEGKGKDELVENCFACHQFQTRMAAMPRDRAGWNTAMKLMRVGIAYRMGNVTDQDAEEMITYLDKYFGKNSQLPKSPIDLPTYNETVRPFSDEAMKIVYVDYEMPSPNVFPWSGAPDAKGNIWIPFFGAANRIAKLDPVTGAVEEFRVPFTNAAGVHSAHPAPDGSVWLAEQGSNRVGKWDPVTRKITEYQDNPIIPTARGGGGKITTRVDSQGIVWSTGHPFSRLDPKTGQFTQYPEIPTAYGMAIDKQDNAWFTALEEGKSIGRVDAKTGKVTRWEPPTPRAWPRRMAFDSQGILWFSEYYGGKIGRFDPKTETFKEYQLPGADPTPYALGVDKKERIWYSSMYMNVVGCLDPKTGKVIEYPIPYSENTMREFFFDSQGRMWFGSPANNKVGYFTLRES